MPKPRRIAPMISPANVACQAIFSRLAIIIIPTPTPASTVLLNSFPIIIPPVCILNYLIYSIFMENVNPLAKIQEKQIKIDGLNVNYKIIGDGNIPIILLHGWGVDSDKYLAVVKYLSEVKSEKLKVKSYCIYLLDLPGFGKSDSPLEVWGVDEYVELVKKFAEAVLCHSERSPVGRSEESREIASAFLDQRDSSTSLRSAQDDRKKLSNNNYVRFILIGHSFGGQIAIKFAVKYPECLKVLILTGAAGIRYLPTFKHKIFFVLAKIGKIIFSLPLINKLEKSARKLLYKAAQEKDYYAAKGVMKEVFKKVVKEDLSEYFKKVQTPTLLVWGKNDHSTPLKDGQLMHFEIRNSKFEIFDDSDHRAPYQYPEKFAKIVLEFIKKSDEEP